MTFDPPAWADERSYRAGFDDGQATALPAAAPAVWDEEHTTTAEQLQELHEAMQRRAAAPAEGLRAALEEAITLPLGGGWQHTQAQWRKIATEYDRAALARHESAGSE